MPVIRAVLFDIGGVIIPSPLEAFALYERDRGLPVRFISTLILRDPDTNAWARHERGEVTAEGFVEMFEAEARAEGQAIDARALLGLMRGEVRSEMRRAVLRIREHGLRIGLLTNNFAGADGAGTLERSDIAEIAALADAVVESSRAGVRKPERAFYELACARLAIDPAEAVFLDDLGVNLKPAREMGMTTIKVVDPVRALHELGELLRIDLITA